MASSEPEASMEMEGQEGQEQDQEDQQGMKDALYHIFSWLDVESLKAAREVCLLWNQVALTLLPQRIKLRPFRARKEEEEELLASLLNAPPELFRNIQFFSLPEFHKEAAVANSAGPSSSAPPFPGKRLFQRSALEFLEAVGCAEHVRTVQVVDGEMAQSLIQGANQGLLRNLQELEIAWDPTSNHDDRINYSYPEPCNPNPETPTLPGLKKLTLQADCANPAAKKFYQSLIDSASNLQMLKTRTAFRLGNVGKLRQLVVRKWGTPFHQADLLEMLKDVQDSLHSLHLELFTFRFLNEEEEEAAFFPTFPKVTDLRLETVRWSLPFPLTAFFPKLERLVAIGHPILTDYIWEERKLLNLKALEFELYCSDTDPAQGRRFPRRNWHWHDYGEELIGSWKEIAPKLEKVEFNAATCLSGKFTRASWENGGKVFAIMLELFLQLPVKSLTITVPLWAGIRQLMKVMQDVGVYGEREEEGEGSVLELRVKKGEFSTDVDKLDDIFEFTETMRRVGRKWGVVRFRNMQVREADWGLMEAEIGREGLRVEFPELRLISAEELQRRRDSIASAANCKGIPM